MFIMPKICSILALNLLFCSTLIAVEDYRVGDTLSLQSDGQEPSALNTAPIRKAYMHAFCRASLRTVDRQTLAYLTATSYPGDSDSISALAAFRLSQ